MGEIDKALDDLKEEIIKTEGIDIGIVDYPYYKHFKDPNQKFESGSLLAFMFLLTDWNQGSGFAFKNTEEDKEGHIFQLYLDTFIKCADNLKQKYPNIYLIIAVTLEQLYSFKEILNKFPNFPNQLLTDLKNYILKDDIQPVPGMFVNALKEGMREL